MNKWYLLGLVAMNTAAASLMAQNTSPIVSNVSFQKDNQNFTATFDLTDAESDNCEVIVRLSLDGGKYFKRVQAGGTGFPVAPGAGKQIVFPVSELDSAQTAIPPIVRIIATDRKPVDIQQIVNQVDSNNLLQYLTDLPYPRYWSNDAANISLTKNQIESFFIQQGLPAYRHDFQYVNQTFQNLIARQSGHVNDSITYIVDAHFDGVAFTPGADDNGSGVVGVLEAARILSQYEFEHSIKYISFDVEEAGLVGSQRYIQQAIPTHEITEGVVNFEMIGYYSDKANTQVLPQGFELLFPSQVNVIKADSSRGNFIVNCSNTASAALSAAFDSSAKKYVPDLKVISLPVPGTGSIAPDLRRSDHAPFWDAGKAALMITDGANFRNTAYHTRGDSIPRLNFTFMANVVKASVGALATLAKPMSAGKYDLEVLETGLDDHHHHSDCALLVSRNKGRVGIQIKGCSEGFGKGTIRIFSLDGKMHHSLPVQDEHQKQFTIDTNLPAGNYIVVADNGHYAINGRLTIE